MDVSQAISEYTRHFIIGGNGFIVGIKDDAPDFVKIKCDELLELKKHVDD